MPVYSLLYYIYFLCINLFSFIVVQAALFEALVPFVVLNLDLS